MEKRINEIKKPIGFVLVIIGLILLFFQGALILLFDNNLITGFSVAERLSSTPADLLYLLELVVIAAGLLLIFSKRGQGIKKHSLDDIIKGRAPHDFRRSAIFFGKKHLNKGHGGLPAGNHNPDKVYSELFNVLELEKWNGKEKEISSLDDTQKQYHRHPLRAYRKIK